MTWQEEMRMGMKLIKDACRRSEEEQGESCAGCPFSFVCSICPLRWDFNSNGEKI